MVPQSLVELAAGVLAACRTKGLKVAAAESCTGGLIAGTLTAVAGSSDVVERGFVTYTNLSKTQMLGVPAGLIAAHGAVSEPVARAMAEGALAHAPADLAVAVTGIAGPTGGTPDKPVGLVHLAAARRGAITLHERRLFTGDRAAVREQTVEAALKLFEASLEQPAAAGPAGPLPPRAPASGPGILPAPVIRLGDVAIAFGGVIAILAGIALALVIGVRLGGAADPRQWPGTYWTVPFLVYAVGAILLAYGVFIRGRGLPWSALGFRPFDRMWYWQTLLGLGALDLVSRILELVIPPDTNQALDKIIGLMVDEPRFPWFGFALFLATVGLLAPLAEEILFRGILYTWLRQRWGAAVSIGTSAAVFGLMHGSLGMFVYAGIIGVILGFIFEKSRSIWPCIMLHSINNLAVVVEIAITASQNGFPVFR